MGYFLVCNWLYVPVEMKLGVNEFNQARAAEQIITLSLPPIERVFLKKPSLKCIGIN